MALHMGLLFFKLASNQAKNGRIAKESARLLEQIQHMFVWGQDNKIIRRILRLH